MPGRQSRNWTFTLNNWTQNQYQQLLDLFDQNMDYLVIGKEISPTTLTPHLQGFLILKKKKTLNGVKTMIRIQEIHLEVAIATAMMNRTYCIKEGDFIEKGTMPLSGNSKVLLQEAVHQLMNGTSMQNIATSFPETYIKHYRGLERMNLIMNKRTRQWKSHVRVYYGSTGTGKTRRAIEEDKVEWTHGGDRWFDGYDQQERVLFDDFDGVKSGITYRKLLQLLDRYPLQVPIKGGFVEWCPRVIVITTNIPPDRWYPDEDYSPLQRRIDDFINFDLDL